MAGLTSTANVSAAATLDVFNLYLAHTASTDSETAVSNGPRAWAGISVVDRITVTGGSGSGTLTLAWDIDGSFEATGGFSSGLMLRGAVGSESLLKEWLYCSSESLDLCQISPTVDESHSLTVPFVFGTPIDLAWTLEARVGMSGMGPSSTASGTVDFAHTARLLPVIVVDAAGQQVEAPVVSDSQYRYAVNSPATVPEPALLGLLGCALASLAARRRTRV